MTSVPATDARTDGPAPERFMSKRRRRIAARHAAARKAEYKHAVADFAHVAMRRVWPEPRVSLRSRLLSTTCLTRV